VLNYAAKIDLSLKFKSIKYMFLSIKTDNPSPLRGKINYTAEIDIQK
jgi:hypothetical protein